MKEKSFHEAGHAVAATVLRTPLKQATMDGVITLSRGTDQERRNQAIIAMAGAAAEALAMNYTKDQCDELLKTAWAQDVGTHCVTSTERHEAGNRPRPLDRVRQLGWG